MKSWNKICGFLTIFFLSALFSLGQKASYIKFQPSIFTAKVISINYNNFLLTTPGNKSLKPYLPVKVISENYYTQHFGFFCKRELALEKATKVPIRFRLGSVQQCDYFEGKKQ